jgi:signal transduction histidine kinase
MEPAVGPRNVASVIEPERHLALAHLIRTCDVVFGSASIVLAGIATWQGLSGSASLGLVLALCAFPAVNLAWSQITRRRDRLGADIVRGVACIPLAAFIYAASTTGVIRQLWLPALMMSVGVGISTSLATRRATAGIMITSAYALGLVVATAIATGTIDAVSLGDAFGLGLVGAILSIVAANLGRSLEIATHERDEATQQRALVEVTLGQLTVAIDKLHCEMERRVAVEAELLQAQKLEAVGRLAAGIAHEINTPVQFIGDSLSFVRTAVDDLFGLVVQTDAAGRAAAEAADLPFLTEELPKALTRAQDGLGRVATIVRSMRIFGHPDGVTMEPADLNSAIEATLIIARNEYKYVADLVTDLAILPLVSCYASEINQAVLSIVVNAGHAIGDIVGNSGERGTIRVSTRQIGSDIEIAIADSGSGIPELIRPRIFDPFFTTKVVGQGTGQGLAIAHHIIVDKHHGKLTFESELGRGTTFFIRLPIAEHAESELEQAA